MVWTLMAPVQQGRSVVTLRARVALRSAWPMAVLIAGLAPGARAQNSAAPSDTYALPQLDVVATSPQGGASIDAKHFPGNVQIINQKQLPANASSFSEVLNQSVGSVNVNDTQGNPFQMDVNYRGFTASPVLGTPQGLSVFMDGMRMNEAFGDVVSWDLIPQAAIAKVTLIPGSNPVYGLNTLGGAISLNTKSGFDFSGTSVKATVGSNARRTLDLEHGGHGDNTSYYLAASTYDDRGWALYNPSKIRQFFAKTGYQDNRVDVDLSLMYADNLMFGNQTVPLSMLPNAQAGYSHPDYTSAQSYMLNLRGSLDMNDKQSVGGNIYYRHITRSILNSNINDWIGGSTNDPTCASVQNCPASNLIANYSQNIQGANVQWSNTGLLLGRKQVLTLGANLEYGSTNFSNTGQDAFLDASNAVVGADAFMPQAQVQSTNKRAGLFVSDTVDLSKRLSVTASARYDYAAIGLSGTSCSDPNNLCDSNATLASTPGSDTLADVSGQHSYRRLNPSLGLTWQFAPQLTGFANYSEGFRTPSAIELACADPNAPCSGLPNAFSADPDLKAVVSQTVEVGLRGKLDEHLQWNAAYFHSALRNDIVFNQTNATQGYFANVAQTMRQGLELSAQGKRERLDYGVSLSWVDARFEAPFALANGANSVCLASANGCTGVYAMPGDKIPGVPALTLKVRLGYDITPAAHIGTTLQAQSAQYARGDENNQDVNGKVPGFVTVKVDYLQHINKSTDALLGVSNLFNTQYANFGMLGFNNLTSGQAEQFRSVGAPRAFYAGLQAKF